MARRFFMIELSGLFLRVLCSEITFLLDLKNTSTSRLSDTDEERTEPTRHKISTLKSLRKSDLAYRDRNAELG